MPGPDELVAEADRQFTICNACRYCEDYCAVFPAMERRSLFLDGDLSYLASVCHDCRACYQACMYTDPHEFAINIPALMAEARTATYRRYARPRWLARAFDAGPRELGLLTIAAVVALVLLYELFSSGSQLFERPRGDGAFYAVVSHTAMAAPALLLSAFGALVVAWGGLSFWRDIGGRARDLLSPSLWATVLREIAVLRYMRGGGGECHFPDELRPSPLRRHLHGLVFWGFLLAFAATVAAFIQENGFGDEPPYPVLSIPVTLGLLGGIAAAAGGAGLLIAGRRAPRALTTERHREMGVGFIWSLIAVSITGLGLLGGRETSALGLLLIVHLGTVLALYLTAPYGKLVHAVYRTAALLYAADERRTP